MQLKILAKFALNGTRVAAPVTAAPHASITACTSASTALICVPLHDVPRNNPQSPLRLVTPLKREKFELFLSTHLDQNFVQKILDVLEFDADIGYRGPQFTCSTANSASSRQHAQFLKNQISTKLSMVHAIGPFPIPSYKFCLQLSGSVSQKEKNFQIILDLQ